MGSKADLRQRCAEDLGLVGIGQDPEAQDTTRIDATFDEVYAFLKEKGLAMWAASGDVPTKLVPAFALMMEHKLCGISYGVPETRYNRIMTEAGLDGKQALAAFAELAVPEYDDTAEEGGF